MLFPLLVEAVFQVQQAQTVMLWWEQTVHLLVELPLVYPYLDLFLPFTDALAAWLVLSLLSRIGSINLCILHAPKV
jgi:hypothetical protein